MIKRIKTLDQAPIDIVEAVKRGFIHRGFIPRKYRRNSQLEDSGTKIQQNDAPKPGDEESEITDFQSDPQEAAKDSDEPEPGEVHEKLIDLTEKAQDVLFTADTVFLLTLFPDTITLDREKLTVIERFFFRVAKVITVPITSMISADVSVGPFFGAVHMTSKYFIDNTHTVKFLWRHDAEEIHRLLQGFIIAHEKNLDVTNVDKEDLCALLEDLGHGTNE